MQSVKWLTEQECIDNCNKYCCYDCPDIERCKLGLIIRDYNPSEGLISEIKGEIKK